MPGLIVHEWAERSGGAEAVVDQLLVALPDSDLTVLWNDAPARYPDAVETWLARTPLRRHKALALPFMPATWRHLSGERDYDWLLVSSHLFAHHARVAAQPDIPKLVYAHTPARYIWEPDLDRRGQNLLVRAASAVLKPLDKKRAQEPVAIAANSNFTKARIERTWQREAEVIYPPVDTERIIAGGNWADHLDAADAAIFESLPETFLLGASRFVPYKRLDLVIDAGAANDLPVVIAGAGPEEESLRARAEAAAVPVQFIVSPSTALLYALYQRALALVFPAVEDFGIMPVEAMAAGSPLVVSAIGGAAEIARITCGGTITETTTSAPDWRAAVRSAADIDRAAVRESSRVFSASRFQHEIVSWVRQTIHEAAK